MNRGVQARLVTLAAIAIGLAGAGMTAHAASPGKPAILTAGRAQFSLNTKWHGTHRIAGLPVQSSMSAPAEATEPVWVPSCGTGEQRISFNRNIELLGPASAGRFSWYPAVDPVPGFTGLKTLDLQLNGEHVYHWAAPASISSYDFPPAALKHVKVGNNSFVVTATRAALPKGTSACNARGRKPSIALEGLFDFSFGTDVRVGVPKDKVTVVQGTTISTFEFLLNQGPDRAQAGELLVDYGGQGTATVSVLNGAKVDHDCEREGNTIWHCRYESLDPGERLSVYAKVVYTPGADNPNWDHYTGGIFFKAISQTPELNYSNNEISVNFIMCQTGSTLPDCK